MKSSREEDFAKVSALYRNYGENQRRINLEAIFSVLWTYREIIFPPNVAIENLLDLFLNYKLRK